MRAAAFLRPFLRPHHGRAVAAALVAALAVWHLGQRVRDSGLEALEAEGRQRLELYAGTLSNAIEKYAYLPAVLARDDDIRALLAGPRPPGLTERVNRKLAATNADAGSAALYLMNAAGLTVAASNWDQPGSFVGHTYDFRPYYQQALQGGPGRWFGVGVTTQQPGYFLSRGLTEAGRVIGMPVVKIDLEPLERDWSRGGEGVMVSDAHHVAILSSRPEWKYGTLADPGPELTAELAVTRQYAGIALHRLDLRERERRGDGAVIVRLQGRDLLMQSRPLAQDGWALHYFSDLKPVAQRQRDVVATATAATFALGLLLLALRQRQLRRRAERRTRAELERMVEDRTRELRSAQEELIHAGKMAALGQMSAALAHEVNQPLAAIQTFLASTRVFAERGDTAKVLGNLAMIGDLAGRMAEITGHLKTFARKAPQRREAVDIAQSLDRALLLLEPALRQADITLVRAVPPGCRMLGDSIRLEQVLVNLLRNAADAMKECAERRLSVTLTDAGGDWLLRIADSGPGIAPQDRDRLFDPFFTTKEVGQGLGLGLSLSYGIVRDFGGAIRAESPAGGGAVFVVQLPKAPDYG